MASEWVGGGERENGEKMGWRRSLKGERKGGEKKEGKRKNGDERGEGRLGGEEEEEEDSQSRHVPSNDARGRRKRS